MFSIKIKCVYLLDTRLTACMQCILFSGKEISFKFALTIQLQKHPFPVNFETLVGARLISGTLLLFIPGH